MDTCRPHPSWPLRYRQHYFLKFSLLRFKRYDETVGQLCNVMTCHDLFLIQCLLMHINSIVG
jgi:hypothetical protein